MSRMVRGWLAMGVALMGAWGAVACAAPTSFEGNAKFPGGVDGCRRQCAARRLDFGSFIYIGEYSTACACKAPPGPPPAPQPPAPQPPAPQSQSSLQPEDQDAAVAAAVAGAELQRRRIEAQQAQAAQSGAIGAAVGAGLAR